MEIFSRFLYLEIPSAPGKPIIDEIYAQSCDLTWSAPDSDGGAPIERYVVEKKEVNERKWQVRKASD